MGHRHFEAKGGKAFLSVCGVYAVLTRNTSAWIHILYMQTYPERQGIELMYFCYIEYAPPIRRVDIKRWGKSSLLTEDGLFPYKTIEDPYSRAFLSVHTRDPSHQIHTGLKRGFGSSLQNIFDRRGRLFSLFFRIQPMRTWNICRQGDKRLFCLHRECMG